MPYANISAEISDANETTMLGNIDTMRTMLPFLISLTDDEKISIPKMGEKSVGFVEKCLEYAQANAKFVPPYLDITEIKKDIDLWKKLLPLFNAVDQLHSALDSTSTAVGSEAYVASLSFYNTVRGAAKRGIPGASAIYEDLRTRFPGRPSSTKGDGTSAGGSK